MLRTPIATLTPTLLVAFAGAPALAQDADPIARPGFKLLRFDEDWSQFDSSAGDDFYDPIKNVTLSADNDIWASFGGEYRVRAESWENFGFGAASTADDTFVLARIKLHGDLHFGENFRIFAEGIAAHATDRDLPGSRRALDVDSLDLRNLFADFRMPFGDGDSVTLRVGRQELLYGKQRLVSPLPWANAYRGPFDAAKLMFEVADWDVEGFYGRFAPVQKYQFNDWQPGRDFWGVHASGQLGSEENPINAQVYYFGLDNDNTVTFNGTSGDELRHTVGARLFGKIADSGFDYDVEGAYQFGDVGSADISAWMFSARAGYGFADTTWSPKLWVAFDYASGDDTAGDGDVGTFNPLFPLGHAYFGYIDIIGRQNIMDLSTGISVKPHEKVTVKLDGHLFWRAEEADAVYNAGGGVLRAAGGSTSDEVGQEIDLTVVYKASHHLTLQGGYSYFFSGDFIEDTGSSEDITFIYAQAKYTF